MMDAGAAAAGGASGEGTLHLLVVVVDVSEAFSQHSHEENASQRVSPPFFVRPAQLSQKLNFAIFSSPFSSV